MNRYCIFAIPRSGSNWLAASIGQVYHTLPNYTYLGEFFTFHKVNEDYKLDSKNNIIWFTNDNRLDDPNFMEEFKQRRLKILLEGDINQPLVLKNMYWKYPRTSHNYLKNLKKIQDHNIQILNLNRDPFDCTISIMVSDITGISHRYEIEPIKTKLSSIKTELDVPKEGSIFIDKLEFKATYYRYMTAHKEKQKIADKLKLINIEYNTLIADCFRNKIQVKINSVSKKLYDIDYSKIIQNYDDLLKLKINDS
jgi:hypothetical protein